MSTPSGEFVIPGWLKLVGATENQVADYWPQDQPLNYTEIWFPWNKPPSDIWQPGRLILYAVGWGALMAEQEVAGPPKLMPRRGPIGSPENRWPHKIAVKTLYYCSPLSQAPLLRDLAPEIADRYGKRFWNGSHWAIDHDEYEQLAAIIRDHGEPYEPHSGS